MKANKYIAISGGKIASLHDCTHEVTLGDNEVAVTSNELAILRACDGDLGYAKNLILDIELRIKEALLNRDR